MVWCRCVDVGTLDNGVSVLIQQYGPVMIVDLLRYDNFVVSFTESCPQRIT